jgi:small GTP-binding protein
MNKAREIQKKILMLGDGAVGKTSLIRRFVVNKFDDRYIATIGTRITAKDMQIKLNGASIYLKLQVWDILGQKGYNKLYQSSFKGVDGAFLVADITRKETLESLKDYWIPMVHSFAGAVPFVVLANKCDLKTEAKFNEKELKDFAAEYKVPSYVTSAKNAENVERAFEILGKKILKHRVPEFLKPPRQKPYVDPHKELTAILDKIIDDFCREYSTLEDAMPILRKQFEVAKLDINHPTVGAVRSAVDQLASYETIFKGKKVAEVNRIKRYKWIKELA